jgi:hypothetical protein
VAPQLLIGGVPAVTAKDAAAPARPDATMPAKATARPLDLSGHVALDPRELQANTMEWARLPEVQRRALLDRYWRLSEMSPADLEKVFSRYATLREQPENRQASLKARAEKLAEFMKSLNPQDQAVLESMGEGDRAKRLLELWQARYGAW